MASLGRLRTDSFLVKNIWFMTATPQPLFVHVLVAGCTPTANSGNCEKLARWI